MNQRPVRDAALRLLSAKPHTIEQLKKKLARKGYDTDEIDSVISELAHAGYLDDHEYAQRFAEQKRRQSFYGKRHIIRQLTEKGVPADIAKKAVEIDYSQEDEFDLADQAIKKKMARWLDNPDQEKIRRRLYGYLQRKGFSDSIIYKAMQNYIASEAEDE